MRKGLVVTVIAALALAAPALAGLPRNGVLVPARSLGGVSLGQSEHAVRTVLGRFHGVCDGCARPTWYVTYRRFDKHGLAVEFARGRVSGVYTLWQPRGWHTAGGLLLGASELAVQRRVGFLKTVPCPGYDALVADRGRTRTVYYLYQGSLWGFGLFRRGTDPCR